MCYTGGHENSPPFPQDDHAGAAMNDSFPSRQESRSPAAQTADVTAQTELASFDLAAFFGPTGPLAAHLEGYEPRPSQLQMAQAVQRALLNRQHALIEAPTGTGKSLAYLVPAILSGRTVVVATANKSLQYQLYTKDLPLLEQVLERPIRAVVVKGRSNFVCNLKWEKEQATQQYFSLYDRADEQVAQLRAWLETTETGDVDELPFLLTGELKSRVVSFPDDCLHSDCRYYHDNCWVNFMRDKAQEAQLIITNHHLLLNALELGAAGERILPPASVYIIDEAHHLEQTATAVYETSLTDYTVPQLLNRHIYREHIGEERLDELRFLNTLAFQEVANLSRENAFRIEGELETCRRLGRALRALAQEMTQKNPYGGDQDDLDRPMETSDSAGARGVGSPDEEAEARRSYELAITALNSTADKLITVAGAGRDDAMVRYAVRVYDRRQVSLEVHAAPIDPANLLSRFLFHPEDEEGQARRTVICTSATLATNGHFEHFKRRCGLLTVGEEWILPPVFDYPRRALLYQPALPSYNWNRADAFYDAVAAEIERLLEVSRGRALCLFTSWSGLQQVSARLQRLDSPGIWPIRAQGDAPRDALLAWFQQTPHSVLLATRSFWEGIDIPGEALSLVVLDKMPFPTPGDPLHSARMQAIEASGSSSFSDYMLPLMTLTLKQGFGRLIRRGDDQGVVAILDERLSSKGYGRQALQDLPPARFSRHFRDVHRFFQQALDCPAEFALNVWAQNDQGGQGRWRWQLLRLQDGKADTADGVLPGASDRVAGELHAMALGLQDLRRRITQAGRRPSHFAVEIRCSPEAAQALQESDRAPAPLRRMLAEVQRELPLWQAVRTVAVPRQEDAVLPPSLSLEGEP